MGKEVVIPFVSGINSTGFCSCLCFCRPIQVVIPFVSGINSTDFLAKGDDVAIIGFVVIPFVSGINSTAKALEDVVIDFWGS